MNKYCVFCKHWNFWGGSPGYSEYTPGDNFEMSCIKDKWNLIDLDYKQEDDFRKIISFADKCEHYNDVRIRS